MIDTTVDARRWKPVPISAEPPKSKRGEITEFIRGLIEIGWSDAQIAAEVGCHRNYPNVVRQGRR